MNIDSYIICDQMGAAMPGLADVLILCKCLHK